MSLSDSRKTEARLISQFGYPQGTARSVAIRLSQLGPELAPLAEKWWISGTTVDLEVHGHSLHSLKRDHGLNDIAGILTLDWLLREPQAALAQLARGHDEVR